MSGLTYLSAGELARLIRERHVSAVEVLDAHLERIERHNPALNAIITLDAALRRRADPPAARGAPGLDGGYPRLAGGAGYPGRAGPAGGRARTPRPACGAGT